MNVQSIFKQAKPQSSHLGFIEDASSIISADHSKFAIQTEISCSNKVTSYYEKWKDRYIIILLYYYCCWIADLFLEKWSFDYSKIPISQTFQYLYQKSFPLSVFCNFNS